VYTKFLLTYTAIYRRNRKVLPLGITALQPQSHFHLGTPYIVLSSYGTDTPAIFLPYTKVYLYGTVHDYHEIVATQEGQIPSLSISRGEKTLIIV
jgi:hypothetical protein